MVSDSEDDERPVKRPHQRSAFLSLHHDTRSKILRYATGTGQALVKRRPRRMTLYAKNPWRYQDPVGKRAFLGLTQTCHQLRDEYLGDYRLKQEIGVDLKEVNRYVETVYSSPHLDFSSRDGFRTGNITIAIRNRVTKAERNGIDIMPTLRLWCTQRNFSMGFGRYHQPDYARWAGQDRESKDLYRLLGCRVLPDRSTTPMNQNWINALKWHVASVWIYRKPINGMPPYIHILFYNAVGNPWLVSEDSPVPSAWLRFMGFDRMERFTIKVGVLPLQDPTFSWDFSDGSA
jgi:hypothetical protein